MGNHHVPHSAESKAKMSFARRGKPLLAKRRPTKDVNGEIIYRCGRCKEFFPLDGYYKDSRRCFGIKNECKKCHVATTISSRNPDTARAINSAYMARRREHSGEKVRERERLASQSRKKDERTKARGLLNAAVRSGKIKRPAQCARCSAEGKVTGHHHDYSAPLIVEWLCYPCHGKEHRRVPPEPAAG